jgi:hypothetical protein
MERAAAGPPSHDRKSAAGCTSPLRRRTESRRLKMYRALAHIHVPYSGCEAAAPISSSRVTKICPEPSTRCFAPKGRCCDAAAHGLADEPDQHGQRKRHRIRPQHRPPRSPADQETRQERSDDRAYTTHEHSLPHAKGAIRSAGCLAGSTSSAGSHSARGLHKLGPARRTGGFCRRNRSCSPRARRQPMRERF